MTMSDAELRAEVAAAWVAGWLARQDLPPSTTVSDDDLIRRGREYAALAIEKTNRSDGESRK